MEATTLPTVHQPLLWYRYYWWYQTMLKMQNSIIQSVVVLKYLATSDVNFLYFFRLITWKICSNLFAIFRAWTFCGNLIDKNISIKTFIVTMLSLNLSAKLVVFVFPVYGLGKLTDFAKKITSLKWYIYWNYILKAIAIWKNWNPIITF